MSDKPKATDDKVTNTAGNVLSEMAEQDVEQPGDTPSDVPPVTADTPDAATEAEPES